MPYISQDGKKKHGCGKKSKQYQFLLEYQSSERPNKWQGRGGGSGRVPVPAPSSLPQRPQVKGCPGNYSPFPKVFSNTLNWSLRYDAPLAVKQHQFFGMFAQPKPHKTNKRKYAIKVIKM